MNQSTLPPLASWLAEPLPSDVAQSVERIRRADDVRYLALMPDVHLAADVCVGAVVVTSELIYPAAVGGDIGCGMAAVAVQRVPICSTSPKRPLDCWHTSAMRSPATSTIQNRRYRRTQLRPG